jgi:hypothetical protein
MVGAVPTAESRERRDALMAARLASLRHPNGKERSMNEDDFSGYLEDGPFATAGGRERMMAAIAGEIGPDPRALAARIRELMVHAYWRGAYGLAEDRERTRSETNLRSMEGKLELIAAAQSGLGKPDGVGPLPPERRLIGNCRDFSLFFSALLRRVGIPARARCGFGMYFAPNHGEDHWVVERLDADRSRWVISDPQLDQVMIERMKIPFDPMDLPDGAFLSGSEAWLACRAGDDPDRYGIFDLKGWDFVKGDFVRDVASLAGLELLPWDAWGVIGRPYAILADEDLAVLDAAARATVMRSRITRQRARELCADRRFALPRRIESYLDGKPTAVDLGPLFGRRGE